MADASSLPLFTFFATVRKHNAESFAKRFPEPMLLYLATVATSSDSKHATTHRMVVAELEKKRGTEASKAGLEQRVAAVKKTPRNPIASQISIGRGDDNDIVVEEPTVSKQHAFFEQRGRLWTLSDLDSANGTFVSGRQLSPDDTSPLTDETVIALGSCEMRFLLPMSFHAHVLNVLQMSEFS